MVLFAGALDGSAPCLPAREFGHCKPASGAWRLCIQVLRGKRSISAYTLGMNQNNEKIWVQLRWSSCGGPFEVVHALHSVIMFIAVVFKSGCLVPMK